MKDQLEKLEARLLSVEDNSKERVDVLIDLAWNLWVSDGKKSIQLSESALSIAQKINYQKGAANAQRNLGLLYYSQSQVEKGMEYFLFAQKWFEENDDKDGLAYVNLGMGLIYWGFGDFDRGFNMTSQALNLFNETKNIDGQAWANSSLGGYYYDWKDYKRSLSYIQKARELFRQTQNIRGEARALNGMGNAYLLMKKNDKALNYQIRSLKLQQSVGDKHGESRTLNDIGLLYQKLGNYDQALEYHERSLLIRQKIAYSTGETTTLLDIGKVYSHQKKFDQAIDMFQQALRLSTKIKAKPKMCKAHYFLYDIYKQLNLEKKALKHHEIYHKIEDEVYHEDLEKKLDNLKTTFQLEASQKEAEINRLKNIELKEKNNELEKTIKKLNAAQAQLLQAGKMVALGNLASGIVHEINSPAGAIKSAVDNSRRVFGRFEKILKSTKIVDQSQNPERLLKLLEVFLENIQVTSKATDRVLNIIKSLKNFTRLDQADFQKININEGIDDTLTLIGQKIGTNIKVTKKYENLSPIYCYPNELNQVFMNLLLNAAKAVENKGSILIQTCKKNGHVEITITDSGKGIPPEKLDHLFEPGFTEIDSRIRMRTGLYSSSNIIHKHQGEISVKSQVGKGSTFIISIPDNLSESTSEK